MPARPLTVTTTVGQLTPYHPQRTSVAIYNNGTAVVYVGEDQPALSTNGFPIAVGGSLSFVRAWGDEPELLRYIVAASGSQNVRVIEQFERLR